MAKGFNIQEFKSVINSNNGLASANKFLVEFPVPRGLQREIKDNVGARSGLLSFYCKATSLPGLGILSADVFRYGYGPIERKPYGVVFNDVLVHMHLDGKNRVKDWFDSWTRLILNYRMDKSITGVNPLNLAAAYEHSYKEDYAVDIKMTSFTPEGDVMSTIVLCEAYPNFIGDIMVDWEAKNQLSVMPVSLTFRDWYNETKREKALPIVEVINPETGEPYPKD